MKPEKLKRRIRINTVIIITGLFISGATAFPIEGELHWLTQHASAMPAAMQQWLQTIYHALHLVNQQYPYLSYGTDWLAFAHIMLAVLFIGPYRHPVKNAWIIDFGIIASLCIFALAFIAGPIRQIPFFWRLIDCSFGVICLIPLLVIKKATRQLVQHYRQQGITVANI